MQFVSGILLILYAFVGMAKEPDTLYKKNQIEVGITGTNFLDGKGGTVDANELYYTFIDRKKVGGSALLKDILNVYRYFTYYSYKRYITSKHCLSFIYQNFTSIQYPTTIGVEGQLEGRNYLNALVGYGYVLSTNGSFQKSKFQLILLEQICYRWGGGETVVLDYYSTNPGIIESYTENSYYNSLGISTGIDLKYLFFKRFTVGMDVHYAYYFEDARLGGNARVFYNNLYEQYKPNRKMVTGNIKIGFLF